MTTNDLPAMCFSYVSSFAPGENVVVIKRGERGCFATTYDETDPEKAKSLVEHLNKKIGVTAEQAECMSIGSMFGWDCPGAKMDKHRSSNPSASESDEACSDQLSP